MKNMLRIISFISLMVFPVIGMENTTTNPSTPIATPISTPIKKKAETKFVFSAKKGGPHKPQKSTISSLEKGDELKIIASHLTDKWFIDALKSTKASTEIILDDTNRNKKAAEEIAKENPKVSVHLAHIMPVHAKTMIAKRRPRTQSVDKITNLDKEHILVMGSRNLSGHAYHNVEFVEKIKNSEVVCDAIKSFENLKKTCVPLAGDKSPETKKIDEQKETIPCTPQKITFLDSLKHKLNKITADRLTGKKVRIATMNLTAPDIINQIKEQAKQGTEFEIIINNPNSDKQKQILNELAEYKNVSTFIYNEGNTKKHGLMPNIMHKKLLLRDKDNLVMAYTGNATEFNETEYNQACINPNYSPESYKNLVATFDSLKSECTLYKKIEKKEAEEKKSIASPEKETLSPSPKKASAKRKYNAAFTGEETKEKDSSSEKKYNTRRRLF